jgi:hypothetical protein
LRLHPDRHSRQCADPICLKPAFFTNDEFVDSEPLIAKLKTMGVNYAQGYLMHRPVPIDELFEQVG